MAQRNLPLQLRLAMVSWSIVLALLLLSGCDSATSGSRQTTSADVGTVKLSVDFSGRKDDLVSTAVPCSSDSTVYDILVRAKNLGELDFVSSGRGEMTFVTSLGGVKNEGNSGKNWLFRINGKLGKTSCGVAKVRPGDQVVWKLDDYSESD